MDRKQLLHDLKLIALEEVPKAVKEIRVEEGDRICYIALYGGTDEDEAIIGLIQLGVEYWRDKVIEKYGIDDKWVIWNSGEMPVTRQNFIGNVEFKKKEALIYDMMSGDDWEEVWEDCQTLRAELAREFNDYDWSGILPITEDFVVYADWEGIDVEEGDLERSIPQDKIEKLKLKNLI